MGNKSMMKQEVLKVGWKYKVQRKQNKNNLRTTGCFALKVPKQHRLETKKKTKTTFVCRNRQHYVDNMRVNISLLVWLKLGTSEEE